MSHTSKEQQNWKQYIGTELPRAQSLLSSLGYKVATEQPLLQGERFLSSVRKMVLIGHEITSKRKVIIKVSDDPAGIAELKNEQSCRSALERIQFAYYPFLSPEEFGCYFEQGMYIVVTEFIQQTKSFFELSREQQFFIALKAFEVQEGVHAVTYEHISAIQKTFKTYGVEDYLRIYGEYVSNITTGLQQEHTELFDFLKQANEQLHATKHILSVYSGFLTHWDFVPHNFRVVGESIYLLDHASFRFGNKYDGWARFINFMSLYNPQLKNDLLSYVEKNKDQTEVQSLYLMRIWRLVELISFYVTMLPKTSGAVEQLTQARIDFWKKVFVAVIQKKEISQEVVEKYKQQRDLLRESGELARQKVLF